MASQPVHSIVHYLRGRRQQPRAGVVSDAQLIDRFVRSRDEAAFELLVWRHSPMVLGVCRRVLGNAHDAEDAFQATFFTLARKAATIGAGQAVGAWLYRVAYRIALRARASALNRAWREQSRGDLTTVDAGYRPADEVAWGDLRALLDAEVSRLPEKYRAAFILCCLEGKTNEEAAEELGCPTGTVQSRLSRARDRLRTLLTRHGFAFSMMPFAPALREATASGPLASELVEATAQAGVRLARGLGTGTPTALTAVRLMEGMLREMASLRRRLLACLLLALGLLGTSAGVFAASHWTGKAEPYPQSCPTPGSGPTAACSCH
jgi:RNA polymerase sigma factor (sigma-70 family)